MDRLVTTKSNVKRELISSLKDKNSRRRGGKRVYRAWERRSSSQRQLPITVVKAEPGATSHSHRSKVRLGMALKKNNKSQTRSWKEWKMMLRKDGGYSRLNTWRRLRRGVRSICVLFLASLSSRLILQTPLTNRLSRPLIRQKRLALLAIAQSWDFYPDWWNLSVTFPHRWRSKSRLKA